MVTVTSFGYGHSNPPEADLTVDARRLLRNPHHDPAMRYLTGLDAPVRDHVLATPGARNLIANIAAAAAALLADTGARQVTLAVGCVGGRHRSVVLAASIADALRGAGLSIRLEHRDVHRPVIQRQPA
jgi:RNase adaptor protein for sRNA GlmZ degradation